MWKEGITHDEEALVLKRLGIEMQTHFRDKLRVVFTLEFVDCSPISQFQMGDELPKEHISNISNIPVFDN